MPHWFSRTLWMALQGAIVVGFVLIEHQDAIALGRREQLGIAFIVGCGAAIAVTFLLTKGWDLSRAGLTWLHRSTRPRVHDREEPGSGTARLGGTGDRAGERPQLRQGGGIE
ncbi:hypothetical protein EKPJFOCH_3857 [Methylobacterium thuringiense]|uniref:Uncharacterized protein n=1 Tax=Methylobacterium thuringiense TaxID=1003091 RepID=A0ABQ4TPQ9_9HYPH|nr:hypothetical protein EKPJFOCH_3857 [Methylobacterium thuringiense]